MIRIVTLLALTITFFVFNACSSNTTPKAPKNWIANFEIDGMVCEHGCKGVIEKEMSKTNGITSFDIDFENETAEVFFDQNIITTQAIISKVETINDGIYKMKLIHEREQINAKEKLPSTQNDPVSVAHYHYQLPNITAFILQWIRI
ncbi:MAG: cation transporter [Flavobacteriales bacterium]|jgi:copper chaperone CopZ|nr:cation transporter [Flavobacteriales bacterium]